MPLAQQTTAQWVYNFSEGSAKMRDKLGGKGAGLAEMTRIGLPVPAGFTVTTDACVAFMATGKMPGGCWQQVLAGMKALEKKEGRKFGDSANPLLVSVRSGAPISMPGMMDTVLNLGLNDKSVAGLAKLSKDDRFAYDSYRRFIQMFSDIVLDIDMEKFHDVLTQVKKKNKVEREIDLSPAAFRDTVDRFKDVVQKETGKPFPQEPYQQLELAVLAVFKSWNNPRAETYRRLNRIRDDMGTAVSVQAMVFGNMGEDSATGVAFTRNPATGEPELYGEFLTNAQGEDVVAGTRTPRPVKELKKIMPKAHAELQRVATLLEKHFGDVQDIEFTIMKDKFYVLQTRSGKRTGFAAVRVALDLLDEGVLKPDQAVLRVEPDQLNQLLRPIFDASEKDGVIKAGRVLAKGLNAGPGGASGRVVFHADDAVAWKKKGEKVILVRVETSPEDIHGMHASEGFLTARGGMTSHAALVARQMGRVCVAGCSAVQVDHKKKVMTVKGKTIKEGEWISLDGFTGEVIEGKMTTLPSEVVQVLVDKTMKPAKSETYQRFARLLELADAVRTMRVRANADQPDQAEVAVAFGAEGIGLCRTEHMFFGPGKIEHMREMILADSKEAREKALAKLLPIQRSDFEGIFRVMDGRPVTVRLLDPPLHEFLPQEEKEQITLAKMLGLPLAELQSRIRGLHESNPMLGHRGCRLGITYSEITTMQARAIIEAAVNVTKEGVAVEPEIMVPLVGFAAEFDQQEKIIRQVATEVFKEKRTEVPYLVGTMIEIPRAAITADEIAKKAEFFSFGTNDLTQTALGVSRDDAGGFLAQYQDMKIIDSDPFATIDQKGVGQLVRLGTERGRMTRPDLKVGVCGEHGGDPESVMFFHDAGLNYVSCSPYRLPVARLAAAHAALRAKNVSARPKGDS